MIFNVNSNLKNRNKLINFSQYRSRKNEQEIQIANIKNERRYVTRDFIDIQCINKRYQELTYANKLKTFVEMGKNLDKLYQNKQRE